MADAEPLGLGELVRQATLASRDYRVHSYQLSEEAVRAKESLSVPIPTVGSDFELFDGEPMLLWVTDDEYEVPTVLPSWAKTVPAFKDLVDKGIERRKQNHLPVDRIVVEEHVPQIPDWFQIVKPRNVIKCPDHGSEMKTAVNRKNGKTGLMCTEPGCRMVYRKPDEEEEQK